jgi:hypothetical protein
MLEASTIGAVAVRIGLREVRGIARGDAES